MAGNQPHEVAGPHVSEQRVAADEVLSSPVVLQLHTQALDLQARRREGERGREEEEDIIPPPAFPFSP